VLNVSKIPKKSASPKGFGMYEVASQLVSKGIDVIRLDVGRPHSDTPNHIKEATIRAIRDGFVHYDHLSGLGELREALSIKLKRDNDIEANPDTDILVTIGLTQAAFAAITATVREEDEVLLFEPGYAPHVDKVKFAKAKTVFIPLLGSEGYTLRSERIAKKITSRTKAIIWNDPQNPTGRVFGEDELRDLSEIAIKHDLTVLSDEAYEYNVYDGRKHITLASLPGMMNRTISMFTFSKAYAMDGWRLGYAVASKELIEKMKSITLLTSTHPSVFIQKGAVAAVLGSKKCVVDMVGEDQRRRDLVVRRLKEIPGVTCLEPEGSIYVFPNVVNIEKSSSKLSEYLLREGHVAVNPGIEYGKDGEGHIRICFGAETYERLEEGIERIEKALKKLIKE
jgi:aspartate aminotransferase